MADLSLRLKTLQEGIQRLAELAVPEHSQAAARLAASLQEELELIDMQTSQVSTPNAVEETLPRGPRHEEIRCPLCSLRSFTYQKGTLRRSSESGSGFEARFHCRSCGHEAWHEAH